MRVRISECNVLHCTLHAHHRHHCRCVCVIGDPPRMRVCLCECVRASRTFEHVTTEPTTTTTTYLPLYRSLHIILRMKQQQQQLETAESASSSSSSQHHRCRVSTKMRRSKWDGNGRKEIDGRWKEKTNDASMVSNETRFHFPQHKCVLSVTLYVLCTWRRRLRTTTTLLLFMHTNTRNMCT